MKDGKEIDYTVEETDLPEGYGIIVNGNKSDGYFIINPHESEKIDLDGVKIWQGETDKDHQRPASVTIRLYADGTEVDYVIVTKDTDWTFKFTGLYKYSGGKEIKYTITEDEVVGYRTEISGMTVTNTWVPKENPPTGDNFIYYAAAMLTASLAGLIIWKRRRRIAD